MKILITGATGYIGSKLVLNFLDKFKDSSIAILIRNQEKCHKLFKNSVNEIEIINIHDLDYKDKINDFSPEIVIHLASYLTSKNDEEAIKNILNSNIKFGVHLLDALKNSNVKYFLNVGTFAEYFYSDGNLDSAYLYSASKTAFRSFLQYYQSISDFKWINIIPYTIYGGLHNHKKVIDLIIDSLEAENSISMTSGEQKLDFINIRDVLKFFDNLLDNINNIDSNFIEFHLGTGTGTKIKELAGKIETIYGKKANIDWGTKSYREKDIMHAIAPIQKAKDLLGWEPTINLDEGIKQIYLLEKNHE